ncbi:MAG TPA: glycosyltransferase family A protein [Solirubrobacterales bacterium]
MSPRVSVIIPAHNAAATLGRTLRALAYQDIEEPFEVIVVDDASADETAAVAAQAAVEPRVVRHDRPLGPGPTRNTGAEEAAGEFLAFTDADCFPTQSWLREGVAALEGADLVQGAVRPDPDAEPQPFDRTVWVVAEVGLYETANLFVRRELFERLGGFEDWLSARIGKPLAEDVWLGWRARRAGARTSFAPQALVHHAVFRRGALEAARERLRTTYFPDIVEKVPELRETLLWRRWFLSRRSAEFDLAAAGALVALLARSPLPLVAALPYARSLTNSARRWGRRRAPRVALGELLGDAVAAGALIAGSVRRRTPVL